MAKMHDETRLYRHKDEASRGGRRVSLVDGKSTPRLLRPNGPPVLAWTQKNLKSPLLQQLLSGLLNTMALARGYCPWSTAGHRSICLHNWDKVCDCVTNKLVKDQSIIH